ncbi:hypothetical protein ACFL3B_01515 [Gemmatimonadota bacterium]
MARPSPQTQAKRRRELSKKEKRKAKEEKRAYRKEQKDMGDDGLVPPGEDPDLFGIVPGPQPPRE